MEMRRVSFQQKDKGKRKVKDKPKEKADVI